MYKIYKFLKAASKDCHLQQKTAHPEPLTGKWIAGVMPPLL
jgi:hypothetical protein